MEHSKEEKCDNKRMKRQLLSVNMREWIEPEIMDKIYGKG